jgi:hypothetical protein
MERKTQECKKFKFKEEKKNTGSLQGEIWENRERERRERESTQRK